MTAQKFHTMLTDIGQAKVIEACSGGDQISLVSMAVGDANGQSYEPDSRQIALKNECYRTELIRVVCDDAQQGWFIAEAIIPESVGGFLINEVGLYDSTGALFAVGKFPATYKPVGSSGSQRHMVIRMIFAVSQTAVIAVFTNPESAGGVTEDFVLEQNSALQGYISEQVEKATGEAVDRVSKSISELTEELTGQIKALEDDISAKHQEIITKTSSSSQSKLLQYGRASCGVAVPISPVNVSKVYLRIIQIGGYTVACATDKTAFGASNYTLSSSSFTITRVNYHASGYFLWELWSHD